MRYVYSSAAFGLFIVDPLAFFVAACFLGAFTIVAYTVDSYIHRKH